MPDFNDLTYVNGLLSEAQEAEHDNREKVREVTHFLQKSDGQWEPAVIQQMSGRPRYTFDKCNPVVDSIVGEMAQAEFGIKVRPAGGEASQDLAKLYDGMIRNIQSISNAKHVFNSAGRKMVGVGFDAWRVIQGWSDTDSFEQDLFIRKVANSVDRVWFDTAAEMQDMSDANWCFVLQTMSKEEYKAKFPEGSEQSVSDERTSQVYSYKADLIVVGEFLYKKPITKELVLMSNNAVYEDDDKFKSVTEELKADGVTEVRRRKHKSHQVMTRKFDGGDWLNEEEKTVFDYIPVIPTFGNFDISENKVVYHGAVNPLMDAQRVYNYAQSRAIEEGALAPRAKYWMTREQAEADTSTLETMNTNPNPVQTYTHVEGQPPPFWTGGAQINPGLQQTANDMSGNIVGSSGIFAANQGDAPQQSGYAIELQQNKGDNSTIKYFESQEIAICHTARILIHAIPKVYDTKRTVRVLGEDGVSKMEQINDQVYDNETQKMVELNDLRKGKYDVTCDVGPAFKSKQQETARAFTDMAALDPSIIEQGKDLWLSNLNVPGMDLLAERSRKQMLEAGIIPDSQMTEEEKEKAQAIIDAAKANPPQPDPVQLAILEQTQANTADIQSKMQDRADKVALEAEKLRLAEQKQGMELQQQIFDQNTSIVDALNTQADTLKTLKEAMGIDTIVGPTNTEAYKQQADLVIETQETQENIRI
ncbi:MAG: hypothetical protein KAJ95_06940 [Gammaproteobacteria bacterium]|nr:hypothetical protein [Gammaproteobacteria bacterium]